MTNKITPPRNPLTHKNHRREVLWQVTIPLLFGGVLILGLAVWTVVTVVEGGSVSLWADISLIYLIVPTMLLAIIPLLLFAAIAYGFIWLNNNLPPYARQAQDMFARMRVNVQKISDQAVEPILRLRSAWAGVRALRRKSSKS